MNIGINGVSLIKAFNHDFFGTARRLQEGGCRYIEPLSDWCADPKILEFYANITGEYSNWDSENAKKRIAILKEYGIDVKGMFVFTDYIEEQAKELGKFCKENGITYVVINYHSYDGVEDIYCKVSSVKNVSRVLKQYNVQLVMHNHEYDLALITDKDGVEKPILEIFVEQCTADELMLEVDTGWLLYAGVDPVEFVKKHMNRIMVLHFKDICKEYKEVERDKIFLACGRGAVDFPAILKVIPAEKKESILYVLDQDASMGDIIEDQITSIRYFQSIGL